MADNAGDENASDEITSDEITGDETTGDENASDENPLDNQPDLERLTEAHQRLSEAQNTIYEESLKFPNLPAIDNGCALLNAIQALTRGVSRLTREVRGMKKQMNNLDRNNAARVQNTYVISSSEPLSPFINPETGHEINGFPGTSSQIRRMPVQQLGDVLRALGLDAGGGRPAKERRLRDYIGLQRQPGQAA